MYDCVRNSLAMRTLFCFLFLFLRFALLVKTAHGNQRTRKKIDHYYVFSLDLDGIPEHLLTPKPEGNTGTKGAVDLSSVNRCRKVGTWLLHTRSQHMAHSCVQSAIQILLLLSATGHCSLAIAPVGTTSSICTGNFANAGLAFCAAEHVFTKPLTSV